MPPSSSHEHEPSGPNVWQRVADATHDVVTPANALDVAAMALAYHGSQRLDTWQGIAETGTGFAADMGDGALATATGTRTELGKIIDHVGDKLKLLFTLPRIWRGGLAPKSLIAAVAIENTANAALTVYDRVANDEPQITEADSGRRAMAAQCFGIGINVVGHKVGETRPVAGRVIRGAGSVLGWGGVVYGAVRTTPDYWRKATGRTRG